MFSARREITGDGCLHAAFPADSLHGLAEAFTALERVYPSIAVSTLLASLNPRHRQSSMSAVRGLREQGRAALRAGPAVAAWVRLRIDNGVAGGWLDGVNDTLFHLSRLRAE